MTREQRNLMNLILRYIVLIVVGVIMIYPLVWMVGASFKTNSEIFSGINFIPINPTLDGYKRGFAGYEGMTLLHFMGNTYKFVIPKVIVTVVSATLTAYGFARFQFIGRNFPLWSCSPPCFFPGGTECPPVHIVQPDWMAGFLSADCDSSLLAGDTYFVYMLIQFLRGIPKELEEAAEIDGVMCSSVSGL